MTIPTSAQEKSAQKKSAQQPAAHHTYLTDPDTLWSTLDTLNTSGSHALSLRINQDTYRWTGLTDAQRNAVEKRFGFLITSQTQSDRYPVIHVQPANPSHFRPPLGAGQLYVVGHSQHSTPTGQELRLSGHHFAARLQLTHWEMRIAIPPDQLPYFLGAFENCLRLMVAFRAVASGGAILHSAAVVHNGEGHLFWGHSGAGKSTTCRVLDSMGIEILSDELNLVQPIDGIPHVFPLPFAGDFGKLPTRSSPVQLRTMHRLVQAPQCKSLPMTPATALGELMAACPYVNHHPSIADQCMDNVTQLVSQLRPRKLKFTPTPDLWETVLQSQNA